MSNPVTADLLSTAPKRRKSDVWTEEQKAFTVYHDSLGTPHSTIASLLNAQFGTSRTEKAYDYIINRICREEGGERRLLEAATRYLWHKSTDIEPRSPDRLKTGSGNIYTDEQRAFIMYHFAHGAPSKSMESLFNEQFSTRVSQRGLEALLWRMRNKPGKREEVLNTAKQYSWYTESTSTIHCPLTPHRQKPGLRRNSSTNDLAATPNDTRLSSSRDWTKEQKAFILYHSDRGVQSDVLLTHFNSRFVPSRNKTTLMNVLGRIWKDDELLAHLRQHAEQFPWYTPEPAPGTPESRTAEKAQRRREARRRMDEKKSEYKKVTRGDDPELWQS